MNGLAMNSQRRSLLRPGLPGRVTPAVCCCLRSKFLPTFASATLSAMVFRETPNIAKALPE
jgi:hypothetical protein